MKENIGEISHPDLFAFSPGQCVNHVSGGMASIVIGRGRTENGREHYRLKDIKPSGACRERWFLGEFLAETKVGGMECGGCPMRWLCFS